MTAIPMPFREHRTGLDYLAIGFQTAMFWSVAIHQEAVYRCLIRILGPIPTSALYELDVVDGKLQKVQRRDVYPPQVMGI